MDWRERISIDPGIMVGKPCIKGTRITVEFVMELLADGWNSDRIIESYPHLTHEDIQACLHCAGTVVHKAWKNVWEWDFSEDEDEFEGEGWVTISLR